MISKALEKDRDVRYQHASDLLADFKRLKRQTESAQIPVIESPPDKKPKGRKLWVLAACIVAIGVAATLAWHLRSSRASQIDSIAVLPFANVDGDANADYLSNGITESLINSLTHVPQLKVKSRQSAFRYKGKDVDLQKVGNELGVSALVSGRVVPRGDTIEVSAELTDVRDNTEMWGQHLLLAARNPSANRSLIAFTAWSSFAHAAVMTVQVLRNITPRTDMGGILLFVIVGLSLIVLAPAKQPKELASAAGA